EWAEVGLHPSMASNSSDKALKMEFARLAKTTGKKVDTSRQHFLYLDLPNTYRRLIDKGIEVDFTMGFADHVGFRAGTSHPFPWYDLKEEKMTSMFLMPLSLMDASLQDYMGLSPDEALVEVQRIKEEVKAVNGTFVSLWHNDSVTDHGTWQGWKKVFLECLAPTD
ncbi:MAG: polysaccharide deacetylase family protein, partial [Bacteroidetes bacterium]|nr:polysaccharide deacetylase family protein [Bacteroidota bacterium]